MAPGLNQLLDSSRSGLIDGPVPAGLVASDIDDEMARLEKTYQESKIRAGEEVEVFAKWLDECTLSRGTTSEKRARIFKLLDNYHGYARDKADTLRERQRLTHSARSGAWAVARTEDDSGRESNDMDVDSDDDRDVPEESEQLRKWEAEAQTWDLLRRLLPLRYKDPDAPQNVTRPVAAPGSRRQYWEEFMLSDNVAQERKAILEWLQSNASTGPDIHELVSEYQKKADRGEIVALGWLHTRASIKLHKQMNAWPHVLDPQSPDLASFPVVTQLDPDAMTRQGRKLESEDEYFERATWLGCFHLLRRGRSMNEIRDWCAERSEGWRAATLSALPLSNPEDEDRPDFDPASVILWRRMCYNVVKQGGTDDFERAVYGILSGDIASVEKIGKTWDDFVFANYNALLRTQFDSYLVERSTSDSASSLAQSLPTFNALQFHGDPWTVGKRLVATLSSDQRTAAEAKTVTKALQGAILADDVETYLFHQGVFVAAEANKTGTSSMIPTLGLAPAHGTEEDPRFIQLADHDGLRVITHILIIMLAVEDIHNPVPLTSRIIMPEEHLSREHLIVGYASFLRLANLEELIPLYCSKLHGTRRYDALSRNLVHLTDRESQLTQLNLMQRLGLDVETFLKRHPQIFLSHLPDARGKMSGKAFQILAPGPPTIKFGRIIKEDFLGEELGEGDLEPSLENLIRSLEWLLLVDGLLLETCEYGIKIYKYFLKHLHLDAARFFSRRVSVVDIFRQKTGKEVPDEPESTWLEDLFGTDPPLLDEMIDEGAELLYGAPRDRLLTSIRNFWELESLVKALDNIETISGIGQILRENPHTTDRSYVPTLIDVVKLVKIHMKPLLKNFLLESNDEDRDFHAIREVFLPETIIAYVSSLQFAGTTLSRDNMLEAMELAATLAEKDSDIAPLFVKTGRMKELLEAFASCSKALAIWTGDHKKGATSSKKLREMGWSRELWSVKP